MIYCHKTGKQVHYTKGEAHEHLYGVKQRTPDYRGHVYICKYCGGYHVGSDKYKRKREKNAIYNRSDSLRTKKYLEEDVEDYETYISEGEDNKNYGH